MLSEGNTGVVLLTQQYGAGWETWKRWAQTLPRKISQKAMMWNLNSSWSVWNVLVALGQVLQMAILQIKTQSVELHTTLRKHSCPWRSCYDWSPSLLTGSESCFYKNGKERDNCWGTGQKSFWWLAAGKGRVGLVSRGSQVDEMGQVAETHLACVKFRAWSHHSINRVWCYNPVIPALRK